MSTDLLPALQKNDGGTPNASLRSNQVGQNPFVSTLPGAGNGQTLVTLGPCAGNTVHTHPRGALALAISSLHSAFPTHKSVLHQVSSSSHLECTDSGSPIVFMLGARGASCCVALPSQLRLLQSA